MSFYVKIAKAVAKQVLSAVADDFLGKNNDQKADHKYLVNIYNKVNEISSKVDGIFPRVDRLEFSQVMGDYNKLKPVISGHIEEIQAYIDPEKKTFFKAEPASVKSLDALCKSYFTGVNTAIVKIKMIKSAACGQNGGPVITRSGFSILSSYMLNQSANSDVTLNDYVKVIVGFAGDLTNTLLKLYAICETLSDWKDEQSNQQVSGPKANYKSKLDTVKTDVEGACADIWEAMYNQHPNAFQLYYSLYVNKSATVWQIIHMNSGNALDANCGYEVRNTDSLCSQDDLCLKRAPVYIDFRPDTNNKHQQWIFEDAGEDAGKNFVRIKTAVGQSAYLGVFKYAVPYILRTSLNPQGGSFGKPGQLFGFPGQSFISTSMPDWHVREREFVSVAEENDARYFKQSKKSDRSMWRILLSSEESYFILENKYTEKVLDGDAGVKNVTNDGYHTNAERLQLYTAYDVRPQNPYLKWKIQPVT